MSYEYKGHEVGRNYPIEFSPYWSNKERMDHLQRRIIIYSIQYYELNENVVSDKFYDAISQQLVWYMRNVSKEICKTTMYWYAMYDFDGSTGFHIRSRLYGYDNKYLTHIAQLILKQYRVRKISPKGR